MICINVSFPAESRPLDQTHETWRIHKPNVQLKRIWSLWAQMLVFSEYFTFCREPGLFSSVKKKSKHIHIWRHLNHINTNLLQMFNSEECRGCWLLSELSFYAFDGASMLHSCATYEWYKAKSRSLFNELDRSQRVRIKQPSLNNSRNVTVVSTVTFMLVASTFMLYLRCEYITQTWLSTGLLFCSA